MKTENRNEESTARDTPVEQLERYCRECWQYLYKTGKVSNDIPHNPNAVYEDWVSWSDWMGITEIPVWWKR